MGDVPQATIDLKLEVDPVLVTPASGDGDVQFDSKRDAVLATDAVTNDDGRTYHGLSKGAYVFPNDPREQNRLDFQHEMCDMILDGQLGLAPIKSPEHVLDAATGTGLWAIEFAERNPNSKVHGTDLSEIQRKTELPNLSFSKLDIEKQDWKFDHQFDYVHLRYVVACFDDTKAVFQRSFQNLRPGGYIELFDVESFARSIDDTLAGTALLEWCETVLKGNSSIGRASTRPSQYKGWLEEVGFVDVVDKVFTNPGNTWPRNPRLKQIGAHQRDALIGIMPGFSNFIRMTGMEQAQIDDLVRRAEADMRNTDIHFYWPIHVIYGRKPEA